MVIHRIAKWSVVCSSAGILAMAYAVKADDYPQWRGPSRTGISKESGLLKEWPKEGPKLLWQLKDVGYGFGAPSVVGSRIYLLSNNGPDEEFVQARDAKDGSIVWTRRIGNVGFPKQVPNYPGARSTPTVAGKLLFVLGSDGDLACLETATGKVRWQKNLRTEFGGMPGVWAYSESPLVDGDAVICTPGGTQATMLALNKDTGQEIWRSAVPSGDFAGYASAVVFETGGVRQYVQFVQKGLIGLDAKTGKLLWRYDKSAERSLANIPTPVTYREMIYSASGAVGGGVTRIKTAGEAFEAEQVYLSRKLPNAIGGSVLLGEYLYGTTGTGLQCVEFATGNVKWEDRAIGAASLLSANGQLYLHGENGDVALVEATPEVYREKGRFTPPDPPERRQARSWAYPVVSNGRLYIRDLGTLWCYDVRGGRAR